VTLTIVATKTFVKQVCTFGAERMGFPETSIRVVPTAAMSTPPTPLSGKSTPSLPPTTGVAQRDRTLNFLGYPLNFWPLRSEQTEISA